MHTYRPELDGLRALAIIPVILFHLNPEWLPGGFLGVDVFFVLSGYLITATILPRMEGGGEGRPFSFRDFYFRRVRRLLPAMLLLILVLQVLAVLILFTSEWRSLSAQAGSVLGLCANVFFWKNAEDYWGPAAESMPLLHAWSLSVEEQFYLLYPVLLFLALRCKALRRAPVWLVAGGGLVSFVAFVYARRAFPSAAFYWSVFRAWELLAGCLVAQVMASPMMPRGSWTRWIPLAGTGLIIAGYLYGWGVGTLTWRNAGTTVLGSCLVVAFARPDSRVVWRWLTLPAMVGIGLISYSLYLWHWPVIVFSRMTGVESAAAMAGMTVALAYGSYRFVEKPLRFCPLPKFRVWFSVLAGAALLSMLPPFVVERPAARYAIPGWSSAVNLEPGNQSPHYEGYTGSYRTGLSLFAPEDGAAEVVLLGDSHSMMFFPVIRKICRETGLRLTFFGAGSATSPFFVEEGAPLGDYGNANAWMEAERRDFDGIRRTFLQRNRPGVVMVCARWSIYKSWTEERFFNHLRRLRESAPDSRFIFLGQPPELPFGGEGFTSGSLEFPEWRAFSEKPHVTALRRRMHERLRKFCAASPGCTFVETGWLFEQAGQLKFMEGETLYYYDDDHLSTEGALLTAPVIREALQRAR